MHSWTLGKVCVTAEGRRDQGRWGLLRMAVCTAAGWAGLERGLGPYAAVTSSFRANEKLTNQTSLTQLPWTHGT